MMAWLTFKASAKTAWIWLKEHWQIPFLLAWTIATYILTRRNSDAVVEVLEARKASYEKQISELKKQHKSEIRERDLLIEEYHKAVEKIEKKFEEEKRVLSKKEKKRVKEIVKKSKGEPNVIRKEIEESFGFIYVD